MTCLTATPIDYKKECEYLVRAALTLTYLTPLQIAEIKKFAL